MSPLSGLSILCEAGQPTTILGGHGTGKSSLCKWLNEPETKPAGVDISTDGNCAVLTPSMETELLEKIRHDDDSSYVEGGFDPGPTAMELILNGQSNKKCGAMAWMEELDLIRAKDTPFRFLSNGEVRRCLWVRALLDNPDILVLDTPFEGLDQRTTQRFKDTLETWSSDKILVLMVQRFDDWPNWIEKGWVLTNGRLAREAQRREEASNQTEHTPAPTNWPAELLGSQHEPCNTDLDSQKPLLELIGLKVRLGDRTLFENFSWKLEKGQHWMLTGPNGVGKTTLLSILYADHPQAYGQNIRGFGLVRGNGESIWDWRRHMALVNTDLQRQYIKGEKGLAIVVSGLFDSIGLYKRPEPSDINKAKAWLSFLGLENLGHLYSDEMSYAEMRMLLIARAIIKLPKLLILDEPCQGLDTSQRHQVLSLIETLLQHTPTQLLYVTHHPNEAISAIGHHLELTRSSKDTARPYFHHRHP